MDEHLVGYLLDALDPDSHRQVEGALRDDSNARRRLEHLRRILQPLEADRACPEVPRDLVARTIGRVAECACRGASDHVRTPEPAPAPAVPAMPAAQLLCDLSARSDRAASRPPSWRRADLLVAACLSILVGGILTAGIAYLHHQKQVMACADHMRQFHQALATYADTHAGCLPQVQDIEPDNRADCFGPILREAGLLPADLRAACPAARPGSGPVGYAYTLGYRGSDGELVGLRVDDSSNLAGVFLPVLADRPSQSGGARGNTPDHRRGQNVLYLGGHVRFCTNTQAGVEGDDIYVNHEGRVAAGLGRYDTVLGVGPDQP
jgi:hypothetical protein